MENKVNTGFGNCKKIHAALIGTIIFVVLIKVLGMNFILHKIITDSNEYNISLDRIDDIMKSLFIYNLKNLIIVAVVLRLKHGTVYKYIYLTVTTLLLLVVLVNVLHYCNTLLEMMSGIALYTPRYLNSFIYVTICEKTGHLYDNYKYSRKFGEECIALIKLFVVVASSVVIMSFLQTSLSIAFI